MLNKFGAIENVIEWEEKIFIVRVKGLWIL